MNMKSDDLELRSLDELWALRMEIDAAPTRRISPERSNLSSDCGNSGQVHLKETFGENGVPIRGPP
jgi:hypothetical protein